MAEVKVKLLNDHNGQYVDEKPTEAKPKKTKSAEPKFVKKVEEK